MHGHAVHWVTYVGDENRHFKALAFGPVDDSDTLNLLVYKDENGWGWETSVPHGSAEQGRTWF